MVYINGTSKWMAGIFTIIFVVAMHFTLYLKIPLWVLAIFSFICMFITWIARADTKTIITILCVLAGGVYLFLWDLRLVILYGIIGFISVWRGHES